MQVEEFLQSSASRFPQKTALVCQGDRWSYGEVDRLSDRLAGSLKARGLHRGDRVAIFLDNSVEAVVSIFGVLKMGGVFLPASPSTKADKLAYLLNDCRAAGLISDARLSGVASEAAPRAPSLRLVISAGDGRPERPFEGVQALTWEEALDKDTPSAAAPLSKSAIDIDLAAILYTSGSTGFPKGVMMTHLNIATAAASIMQYLENKEDDVVLSALPLSFDYGLYQVLMAFKAGATLVLERSFAYPQTILERLIEEKATGFPIVPTVAAMICRMKEWGSDRFPHLRYITSTAAPLAPAHISRLRSLFPTAKIYSMYGLTECKRVSYLPPEELDVRPASVGRAIPNTEVYIVDEWGARVGPGEVGELVVRGAHVMKGYWEREEETERALKPGPLPGEKVLYTGDLFRMDSDGYLYFVARKDDIIKTRGEKVSPKEVEAVLYRLPEIAEAAVVGVQDEVLGQAVKAVVVLTEGTRLTAQEISRHCARYLEEFMIPKYVEFREGLPKNDHGKILKAALALRPGRSAE